MTTGLATPVPTETATRETLGGEVDGLRVTLDLVGGTVVRAVFTDAGAAADVAVLRAVERCAEGVSLREASEHAGIYAAEILGPRVRRVPGIMLPRNAHPDLMRAERLLRSVYLAWAGHPAGRREDWNFEDHAFTESWLSLSEDKKLSLLRSLVDEFAGGHGLAGDFLSIIGVDEHERIDVDFSDEITVQAKPKLLMDFERFVRQHTGERLEFFVTEMKDKNRLRRL